MPYKNYLGIMSQGSLRIYYQEVDQHGDILPGLYGMGSRHKFSDADFSCGDKSARSLDLALEILIQETYYLWAVEHAKEFRDLLITPLPQGENWTISWIDVATTLVYLGYESPEPGFWMYVATVPPQQINVPSDQYKVVQFIKDESGVIIGFIATYPGVKEVAKYDYDPNSQWLVFKPVASQDTGATVPQPLLTRYQYNSPLSIGVNENDVSIGDTSYIFSSEINNRPRYEIHAPSNSVRAQRLAKQIYG